MRSRVDIGRYGTHSCLVCHRSPEVLWHIPSHICNGKPFRVFQSHTEDLAATPAGKKQKQSKSWCVLDTMFENFWARRVQEADITALISIISHLNGLFFLLRQCLHLVTAAPSYRLCKPRGHGGKRSQHTSNSHLDCGCVTLVAKETFEGKRQAM
ncbi:uncharacterized protein LOC142573248 isoform X1 [Dermacentor variabilis]|uniref:uncharacterized protein LOC142573248 isoform X1 n=1 Tax=Dermacentor variabilis TaxID=34621 RepID=UPI003F5C041C